MNELQAKTLKAVALGLIGLAAVSYAYTYHREIDRNYPARSFSVDASADIDTTPDIAMFTATVTTEGGNDIAALQGTSNEKMKAVNDFVKEEGVKAKDLKTLQYNLVPRYTNPVCTAGTCPPATISGYTMTQALEVKVRDMEQLNTLLGGVITAGANTVSDVRFVLDDDTKAKNEAREEAIAKAKTKAEATAKAAGVRLGDLVTLYETSDMPQPIAYGMGGAMELSAKMNAAPTIEPGVQTTKVTVTLTYEVKP